MITSVNSCLIGVVVKLNIIAKICKYRGRLHERHLFISMTMEMPNSFKHDMDRFIKECVYFFHNRQLKGHLSLSFYI